MYEDIESEYILQESGVADLIETYGLPPVIKALGVPILLDEGVDVLSLVEAGNESGDNLIPLLHHLARDRFDVPLMYGITEHALQEQMHTEIRKLLRDHSVQAVTDMGYPSDVVMQNAE